MWMIELEDSFPVFRLSVIEMIDYLSVPVCVYVHVHTWFSLCIHIKFMCVCTCMWASVSNSPSYIWTISTLLATLIWCPSFLPAVFCVEYRRPRGVTADLWTHSELWGLLPSKFSPTLPGLNASLPDTVQASVVCLLWQQPDSETRVVLLGIFCCNMLMMDISRWGYAIFWCPPYMTKPMSRRFE